jgi:RNA 3'-terminal phosphate cyclase-like protein
LAESTTGSIHCSEAISQPGVVPEDIALQATRGLLAELLKGGCVDRKHQCLVLLFMVLGSEDVGRCRMGEPTPRTFVFVQVAFVDIFSLICIRIQFLRDARAFFGTSFKIVPAEPGNEDSGQLLYSCYGTGYINTNRTIA